MKQKRNDPWVRVLNGKRGLHIVMLYLVIGGWRVPWSFRIWRGKGYASPSQLACKLLTTVPIALSQHRRVIVRFRYRVWHGGVSPCGAKALFPHAVVGMRCNRRMQDGRTLKQLYRRGQRGQQVHLVGMTNPVTVSWFWLHRADGKRELRNARFYSSLLRGL